MKSKFIASGIFALAFIVLIVLVSVWNVAPIGPEGTEIGLSSLNKSVHDALGVSEIWYDVTEIFGYVAIATVAVFGLIGIYQIIKRKSIFKVDKKLIALAGLYCLMALAYVLFEIVVINYRPVVMPGDLHVEASFPSSHTMLVCVIMGSAFVILKDYVKNNALRIALQYVSLAIAALTVAGRLLSGVHWLTDIIGGFLISLALVTLYSAVCDLAEKKN